MKTLINIILFTVLVQTLTAAPVKFWTYAYNDTGARKQVVEDGELTDDTINIAGQVISRTGLPENSYAYDNDGNLEQDANWNYVFNEANQLVRMDNKEAVGYTVTFSYDFSGRRYEKSVLLEDVLTERTTYVYDGQRVIAEIDSLEEAVEDHELERTYTHGLYVDEVLAYTDHVDDLNSETYYVTTDRQFSVRSVVDSQGNIVEERNYDPFGKDYNQVAESSDLAYGFTGRRYDAESDLYYFRARYYSTDLGSFISRDPVGDVDGVSVYSGYFATSFDLDWTGLGKQQTGGRGNEYAGYTYEEYDKLIKEIKVNANGRPGKDDKKIIKKLIEEQKKVGRNGNKQRGGRDKKGRKGKGGSSLLALALLLISENNAYADELGGASEELLGITSFGDGELPSDNTECGKCSISLQTQGSILPQGLNFYEGENLWATNKIVFHDNSGKMSREVCITLSEIMNELDGYTNRQDFNIFWYFLETRKYNSHFGKELFSTR